jgi:hypothetical protein
LQTEFLLLAILLEFFEIQLHFFVLLFFVKLNASLLVQLEFGDDVGGSLLMIGADEGRSLLTVGADVGRRKKFATSYLFSFKTRALSALTVPSFFPVVSYVKSGVENL